MAYFEPGEVAVLLHNDGGRLFTVFSVEGTQVVEKTRWESQQKYTLPVNENQLVKCFNVQEAQDLVRELDRIQDEFRRAVYDLSSKRRRDFAAAVMKVRNTKLPNIPPIPKPD